MADTNKFHTLGRMDLMSIAVGQIIGSGVMVMSISALGMTGRSVNIAFVVAAVLTIFNSLPYIYMGSTIRVLGGYYSQAAIFVGGPFAGFYAFVSIFSGMSMAMYATGLVSYLGAMIPVVGEHSLLFGIITFVAFTILNMMGTEWMAKAQQFMFYLLVVALVMFTIFGLPHVQWGGYFGNELFGEPLFSNGVSGLLEAASYLTFATGGATVIVQFSDECKNPTADIPFVVIVSTVAVAVLYAFMACVIGGVMPATDVIAAGNLSVIAKQIMPTPCYYFFMICGACFALGTTLNSSLASSYRTVGGATADGWFPAIFAKRNSHNVPYVWLLTFAAVNIVAMVTGMNVSMLGKLVLFIGKVNAVFLVAGMMKLPKLFPEAWAKSPFHCSDAIYNGSLVLTLGVTVMQAYMNCVGQATWVLIANAVMFVVAIIFAALMWKSGKVHVSANYELM